MKSGPPLDGERFQEALTAWAARGLAGRLDVAATARLLGFAEHDIQILMACGKLQPLGDPAPNAPKWFAAIEVIQLAADRDWLHKATREVSRYWRYKRQRRAYLECFARKNGTAGLLDLFNSSPLGRMKVHGQNFGCRAGLGVVLPLFLPIFQ